MSDNGFGNYPRAFYKDYYYLFVQENGHLIDCAGCWAG